MQNKMNMEAKSFALSVTLLIAFLVANTVGKERFYVEDSVKQDGDYYWVNKTEAVIVCNPHNDARDFSVSEIQLTGETTVIVDGRTNVSPNKNFSLHITDNEIYRLSIKYPSDLSQFQCKWHNPFLCIIWCIGGSTEKYFVHLRVIESTRKHSGNCTLLSDLAIDGHPTYFVGENISLGCSEGGLNVSFVGEDTTLPYYSNPVVEQIGQDSYLLTITDIASPFNNSKISCRKEGYQGDFCEYFPAIKVYENFDVRVTPSISEIFNGDNLTLTCQSNFYQHASLEWDIPSNVSFSNVSRQELSDGEQLLITNINVPVSTNFWFICKATVGSKSNEASATIYLKQKPTPSTAGTTHTRISRSSGSSRSTAVATPYDDGRKATTILFSVLIPVAIAVVIVCVIVAVIFFRKHPSKETSTATGDVRNRQRDTDANEPNIYHYVERKGAGVDGSAGVEVRVEDSSAYYYVDAKEKSELGLAPSGSEVANNVTYMSYDTNYA